MVLVGNKVDLEKNRKVETQEAKDIVSNTILFIICSRLNLL